MHQVDGLQIQIAIISSDLKTEQFNCKNRVGYTTRTKRTTKKF